MSVTSSHCFHEYVAGSISSCFYIFPQLHGGKALWGVDSSLAPAMLCRNNLNRAWGILYDMQCV